MKRALFNRPAWASTNTKPKSNEEPIFGQAHHYQEILETERERRERHAAKQKERAEKEKQKQAERERATKRRRISDEASDSDYGSDENSTSVRSGSAASQQSQKSEAIEVEESTRVLRNTPQKSKTRLVAESNTGDFTQSRSATRSKQKSSNTINLDDDDDDDDNDEDDNGNGDEGAYSVAPTRQLTDRNEPLTRTNSLQQAINTRQQNIEPESEEEEDDEYLRELKIKARQEAQSLKTNGGTGTVKPSTAISGTEQNSTTPATSKDSTSQRDKQTDSETPQYLPSDTCSSSKEPEVKIWIRTIIPGAKEVIVQRKISQPLDTVREFWIKRNQLDEKLASKVFFTWNNTRLYNSTTMRGIIARLKRSHPKADGGDPSEGKIIVEAVTEEIFEYRQKQRAAKLAEAAGTRVHRDDDNDDNTHDDDNDGNDASRDPTSGINKDKHSSNTQRGDASREDYDGGNENEDDPAPKPPVPSGIIIKLKSPNLEDLPIRVRPHTTTRKILMAFLKLRGVSMESYASAWLSYDGDRLDPESTVEEVGFEHEDTVEVYLR